MSGRRAREVVARNAHAATSAGIAAALDSIPVAPWQVRYRLTAQTRRDELRDATRAPLTLVRHWRRRLTRLFFAMWWRR